MTRYRNPPIVEAVCEFRFSSDTPWEKDLPQRFYEVVKEQFPLREFKNGQELQIKASGAGIEEHRVEAIEIPIFLKEDRRALIQFGSRALSIHCLKPYPSWKGFLPIIHQVYTTIQSLTTIQKIDRISLLYVDKIEIPGERIRLEDYFKFCPNTGDALPKDILNFMVGCDFSYKEKRDICRLKLTRAMPEDQNSSMFLLTTDYFLAQRNTVKPQDALSWLEDAHIEVTSLFKGCITETLEELFNKEE